VYVSAWIKRHYPDVFCAAILNSQPMGFYQPAQLVRDAREHGVEVRPPDISFSDWDCTLEPASDGSSHRCVRLGLRQLAGLPELQARAVVTARGRGYADLHALWMLGGVSVTTLERLAEADAFRSLGLDRRAALWAVKGLAGGAFRNKAARATAAGSPLLTRAESDDLFAQAPLSLPPMTLREQRAEDYDTPGPF